ncbi:MAG: hypothetical protein IJA34_16595 [Lachnospiraceae bacterium]|nr:hypothetical protein [Lachnospiraceae bacterium]
MAFILNNMGYHVVVNDMSNNREMSYVVSLSDFNSEVKTYRNVDFNFSGDFLRGYDYSIDYFNNLKDIPLKDKYDGIVLNVQVFKSELEMCKRIIDNSQSYVILIIRDKTVNSVNKKYILKYIFGSSKASKIHEIDFDFYDKEYQYIMDYDGIGKMKYLSENYSNVLIKTICSITGNGQGNVKKALKNLKEGKIFDNRFLE